MAAPSEPMVSPRRMGRVAAFEEAVRTWESDAAVEQSASAIVEELRDASADRLRASATGAARWALVRALAHEGAGAGVLRAAAEVLAVLCGCTGAEIELEWRCSFLATGVEGPDVDSKASADLAEALAGALHRLCGAGDAPLDAAANSAVEMLACAVACVCGAGGGEVSEGVRRSLFATDTMCSVLCAALRCASSDDARETLGCAVANICGVGGGSTCEGERCDLFAKDTVRKALVQALGTARHAHAVWSLCSALVNICRSSGAAPKIFDRRAEFVHEDLLSALAEAGVRLGGKDSADAVRADLVRRGVAGVVVNMCAPEGSPATVAVRCRAIAGHTKLVAFLVSSLGISDNTDLTNGWLGHAVANVCSGLSTREGDDEKLRGNFGVEAGRVLLERLDLAQTDDTRARLVMALAMLCRGIDPARSGALRDVLVLEHSASAALLRVLRESRSDRLRQFTGLAICKLCQCNDGDAVKRVELRLESFTEADIPRELAMSLCNSRSDDATRNLSSAIASVCSDAGHGSSRGRRRSAFATMQIRDALLDVLLSSSNDATLERIGFTIGHLCCPGGTIEDQERRRTVFATADVRDALANALRRVKTEEARMHLAAAISYICGVGSSVDTENARRDLFASKAVHDALQAALHNSTSAKPRRFISMAVLSICDGKSNSGGKRRTLFASKELRDDLLVALQETVTPMDIEYHCRAIHEILEHGEDSEESEARRDTYATEEARETLLRHLGHLTNLDSMLSVLRAIRNTCKSNGEVPGRNRGRCRLFGTPAMREALRSASARAAELADAAAERARFAAGRPEESSAAAESEAVAKAAHNVAQFVESILSMLERDSAVAPGAASSST